MTVSDADREPAIRVRRVSGNVLQVELSADIGEQLAAAGFTDEVPVEYLHALLEVHLQATAGTGDAGPSRGVQAVW